MGLSVYRWAIVNNDDCKIVYAAEADDAAEQAYEYPFQPNAIIRLGYAEWNEETQEYR